MADTAPQTARRKPRRTARKLPVPALHVNVTLHTALSQRVYNRCFESIKADIYTLSVSTRTLDLDHAADAAETFMAEAFDQLKRDLTEDIRRADTLMSENDITATGEYDTTTKVDAQVTSPQAKRYLDLIVAVDTLVVRLDALWLHEIIETRQSKDRAYQWQRRLFKTANRIREHANVARRGMQKAKERRGMTASDGDAAPAEDPAAAAESDNGSAEATAAKAGNGASLAAAAS